VVVCASRIAVGVGVGVDGREPLVERVVGKVECMTGASTATESATHVVVERDVYKPAWRERQLGRSKGFVGAGSRH
jgi:hypothetical protein